MPISSGEDSGMESHVEVDIARRGTMHRNRPSRSDFVDWRRRSAHWFAQYKRQVPGTKRLLQEPPQADSSLLDEVGLTARIEIASSRINFQIYTPEPWRRFSKDSVQRRDLSTFLQYRAQTQGQVMIDKLWVEGWEQGAKYWPEEQATAYCNFAIREFSRSNLETLQNYYWYKPPQMSGPDWLFFVHGWFVAKVEGIAALPRRAWFGAWNHMYDASTLPMEKDERWTAAAIDFYAPLSGGENVNQVSTATPVRNCSPIIIDVSSESPQRQLPAVPNLSMDCPVTKEQHSDEDLRVISEQAIAWIHDTKTFQEDFPPLTKDNHERKKLRYQVEMESLTKKAQLARAVADTHLMKAQQAKAEIDLHAAKAREIEDLMQKLDKAQQCKEDSELVRRFVALAMKKRTWEEVDEEEFGSLLSSVKQKLGQ